MLRRIGAEEGGEFKAVASGTLPCGKPVVVNSDGTVSVVSESTVSQALGTPVEHQSTGVENTTIVYSGIENKFVLFFRDGGNSNYGTARVITVDPSDNSITYGAKVVYHSAYTEPQGGCLDVASGNVVSSYKNISAEGEVVVGTVSGTSITFGTAATMNQNDPDVMCARYDPTNQKVVFCYGTNDNYGRARVGTVSGTSISFGSEYVFASANTQLYQQNSTMTYDASADKMVIVFKDVGNSNYGKAIVVTVSGTTLSFGAETTYQSAKSEYNAIAYDPSSGKNLITYYYNDTNGRAVVGTVSGTSISFGSITTFDSGRTFKISMVGSTLAGKVTIAYEDDSDSEKGKIIVGTISGTDPTFGSEVVFDSNAINETAIDIDPNSGKIVIGYAEKTSGDGRSVVFQPEQLESNLTSENYIGMSRGVAVQTGDAASAGSPVVFESAEIDRTQTVFDSQNNKIVITFRDAANSYYGTAIVGTVNNSDNSISFGTPVVIESATLGFFGTLSFDSSNNKVIVPYEISSQGKVKIGTVSGTSISFGSAVNINDPCSSITTVFDSNSNKVAFLYSGTSNYTKSKVGTVSGTSISFGTEVNIANAQPGHTSGAFDSNANKVVFVYRRSSQGRAIVGTISGTDISFGSEAVFHNTNAQQTSTTFDTSNNKIVISYQDYSASPRAGNAVVGTVSGTDISFGTPVEFNTTIAEDTAIVFDSSVNKVIIFYDDVDNSNYGTAISGTVSGTTVSFDSETVFESASVEKISAAFDSNANRAVVAYEDVGNSQYGTAVVFNPTTIATTRAEVADGGNASMDIIGSVSDNQIGLTAGQQYYVQTDGTISTTAGSPSVLAGTAISATELLVKT